jgi:hypothetical protein
MSPQLQKLMVTLPLLTWVVTSEAALRGAPTTNDKPVLIDNSSLCLANEDSDPLTIPVLRAGSDTSVASASDQNSKSEGLDGPAAAAADAGEQGKAKRKKYHTLGRSHWLTKRWRAWEKITKCEGAREWSDTYDHTQLRHSGRLFVGRGNPTLWLKRSREVLPRSSQWA